MIKARRGKSSSSSSSSLFRDSSSLDVPSEPAIKILSASNATTESRDTPDDSLTRLSRYLRIWLFTLLFLFTAILFVLSVFPILEPKLDSNFNKKDSVFVSFVKRSSSSSSSMYDEVCDGIEDPSCTAGNVVKILLSQIKTQFDADDVSGDPRATFLAWNGQRAKLYHRDDACPDAFIKKNDYCWERGSRPFIIVQNRLMEDFVGTGDLAKASIISYRIDITVFSGSMLFPDLPLPNTRLVFKVLDPSGMVLYTEDERGIMVKRVMLPSKSLLDDDASIIVHSNSLGKVSLSIPAFEFAGADGLERGKILPPLLFLHANFMDHSEWCIINPETQVMHMLMNPSMFRADMLLHPKGDRLPALFKKTSNQDAEHFVKLTRNLLQPAMQSLSLHLQTNNGDSIHILQPVLATGTTRSKSIGNLWNFVSFQRYQYPPLVSESSNTFKAESDVIASVPIVKNVHFVKRDFIASDNESKMDKMVGPGRIFTTFGASQNGTLNLQQFDDGEHEFKEFLRERRAKVIKSIQSQEISKARQVPWSSVRRLDTVNSVYAQRLREIRKEHESESGFSFGDGQDDGLFTDLIVEPLENTAKGLYRVLIEKPGQIVTSIVGEIDHVFDMIGASLRSLGSNLKKFFTFIASLFHWGDIQIITEVTSSHYSKMLDFLRSQILGRKVEILEEMGGFLSRMGTSFKDAGEILRNKGVNVFSDMKNVLSDPFGRNQSTSESASYFPTDSRTPADSISMGEMSTSRFVNILSSVLKGGGDNVISSSPGDDGGNAGGMLLSAHRQESIYAIFNEFMVKVRVIFSNETMSPQYQGFMKEKWDAINAELNGPNGVLGARWSVIFGNFGALMKTMTGFGILRISETILDILEVVIRLFGHLMNSRINIPLLTDLFEKHVTKRRENLSVMTLVCFLGSIFVTGIFRFSGPPDNSQLLTRTEADLLISVKNPSNYHIRWMESVKKGVPGLRKFNGKEIRNRLSYLIAGPYCLTKLIAAVIYMTVVVSELLGSIISSPFQFMLLLARFPFFWFLPLADEVDVMEASKDPGLSTVQDTRFIAWLVGWSYFFFGFYTEATYVGFTAYNILRILVSVVPNVYMMTRTWLTFSSIFGGDSSSNTSSSNSSSNTSNSNSSSNTSNSKSSDFSDSNTSSKANSSTGGMTGMPLDDADRRDNLFKYMTYLVESVPVLLSLFRNEIFVPIGYMIPVLTASFHMGRFMIDVASNATFSV